MEAIKFKFNTLLQKSNNYATNIFENQRLKSKFLNSAKRRTAQNIISLHTL